MILPLAEDMCKLRVFLKEQLKDALEMSKEEENLSCAYDLLTKVVMTQILLFNRKRAGEVSKIQLQQFQERFVDKNAEVLSSISVLERKMVEELELVKTVGKGWRMVNIILLPSHVKSLEALLELRKKGRR